MPAAFGIGLSMDVTPPALAARANRILDWLELGRAPLEVPVDDVLDYVQTNKKRSGGKIRWVLVGGAGPIVRDDVPQHVVQAAVTAVLESAPGSLTAG